MNRNYETATKDCRLNIVNEDGEAFLVFVSKTVNLSIDLPCEIVEQLVRQIKEKP